jgi:hypothetical protein
MSVPWTCAETHCQSWEVKPKVTSELPKSDLKSTHVMWFSIIQRALLYVVQELREPFTPTLLLHIFAFDDDYNDDHDE